MKRSTANVSAVKVIILAAVGLIALMVLSGCGKKAMPQPPSGNRPPKVRDLGYSVTGNVINLSWTIPQTHAQAKSAVAGFYIYRSKQSGVEADCTSCPIQFLRIGDVLVRRPGPGQPEAPLVYAQTIEPGFRYIYKVNAYDDDGIAGRDSNLVDFMF